MEHYGILLYNKNMDFDQPPRKQESIEVAWNRILSKFPPKLQEEFRIERPNPDENDIEMFRSVHLLMQDPILVPIEELLIKNRDVVLRTPPDVFEEINQKYQMGLNANDCHVHEQNPDRLREYSKMPAETADPSVLLDGEIWFGTGRFVAALLRGDKSLQVWNLSKK
jgi:hypothetical protein